MYTGNREDIVLEMYCKDAYGYELSLEENQLVVSFVPLRSQYPDRICNLCSVKRQRDFVNQDMQELDKIAGAVWNERSIRPGRCRQSTHSSRSLILQIRYMQICCLALAWRKVPKAGQDRDIGTQWDILSRFWRVDLAAVK